MLAYYLFISIVAKSFNFDVNIFIYWDNAIAMVLGGFYMIYRSAGEGAPLAPATTTILNLQTLKKFGFISVLFGFLVAFFIAGMDERFSALLPGLFEKLVATFIIGILFFMLLSALLWMRDVLPTKFAFKKASELAHEPIDENPESDDFITESSYRDERIDSTIERYAAHAFYFLFGYIILSNLVKLLFTDVRLIEYYDAFIAATVACGYFLFNILKPGIYEDHKFS